VLLIRDPPPKKKSPLQYNIRLIMKFTLPHLILFLHGCFALESSLITRRRALASVVASSTLGWLQSAAASDDMIQYELRDRNMNKEAVIREDYWNMMGKTPPRLLSAPLRGDDPQWNAFGTCASSVDGGNSCTYVSLKQRIPTYSKYGFNIAYGGKDYAKLGQLLKKQSWSEAAELMDKTSPIVDAELKMVLFATAMLTSPNFPGPSRELLVARFYVNEAHFAHQELAQAIQQQDDVRAQSAWEFGKDSWNSYFQVVNRAIVPKVGDKFEPIV